MKEEDGGKLWNTEFVLELVKIVLLVGIFAYPIFFEKWPERIPEKSKRDTLVVYHKVEVDMNLNGEVLVKTPTDSFQIREAEKQAKKSWLRKTIEGVGERVINKAIK